MVQHELSYAATVIYSEHCGTGVKRSSETRRLFDLLRLVSEHAGKTPPFYFNTAIFRTNTSDKYNNMFLGQHIIVLRTSIPTTRLCFPAAHLHSLKTGILPLTGLLYYFSFHNSQAFSTEDRSELYSPVQKTVPSTSSVMPL